MNSIVFTNPLDTDFSSESSNSISSLNTAHFKRSELINEVSYMHVSTSYPNKYLVSFFDFDVNSSLAELVDTFGLSQKHDFHLLLFWVSINEICECIINIVRLSGNISTHQIVQLMLKELQFFIQLSGLTLKCNLKKS